MTTKIIVSAIEKHNTIPIIGQVQAKAGRLTATDMDLYVSMPTDLEDGMYHPQGLLLGTPFKSPLPISDFPEAGQRDYVLGGVRMNKETVEQFAWVQKASSTEKTRYYLNGVYFGKTEIVATDGHRLHALEQDEPEHWTKYVENVILPNKTIKLALAAFKAIKPAEMVIEFVTREDEEKATTWARITIGDVTIMSKTIDGTFPDWRMVVPDISNKPVVPFDPAEFKKALPRLKAINEGLDMPNYRTVAVKLDDGMMYARGDKKGEHGIPTITKLPYAICFNAKYLADLAAGDMSINVSVDGDSGYANGPHVVKAKVGDATRIAVIMPLRV